MSGSWATSGLDLHLDLSRAGDPAAGPPGRPRGVRESLERALRAAVQDGRLAPATRLPSSRMLAADLRIARNTVADAYAQLVAEGWLVARHGAGTWVGDHAPSGTPRAAAPAAAAPPAYDLRPGSPDLTSFPRGAWLAAARRGLQDAPAHVLGYGDPRGLPETRAELAGYLARVRGVRADPERIVVCHGFTQVLALLGEVLHDRGARAVGVEDHGHAHHRAVLARRGLDVRPLPVDHDGADVAALARHEDVRAVLLTPAHQFPLGVALAPERRREAVRWARATGGLVIEDDYDGELRYDRQPVGAMQALDPDVVAYAGTASKALAPGVHLAWVVLPPHLVDDVVDARRLADRQPGVIDQLTLTDLLASGAYDRHLRRMRAEYRARRDRLVDVLRRRVPGARVSGLAAGLQVVVRLPPGAREAGVVQAGRARGLALNGLATYRAAGAREQARRRDPALVVGYGTPPAHAYEGALERLVEALTGS